MESVGNTSYRILGTSPKHIFRGTPVDTTGYNSVQSIIVSDKAGILSLEFSMDNKIWDTSYSYTYPSVDISIGSALIQSHQIDARYFKCMYTNTSGEAQTIFRLQNILNESQPVTNYTEVINNINDIIQDLIPPPAPDLSDWDGSRPTGVNGKLAFDNTYPIINYVSSSVSVDNSWIQSSKRLGIYSATNTQDITGVLNYQVPQEAGVPNPAYIAQSFGDANKGHLLLYINGIVASDIDLTDVSEHVTTGTGFNISTSSASKYPNGKSYEPYQNRTGSWLVKANDIRLLNGYNYIYVVHTSTGESSFTRTLDRFEFIIDAETVATTFNASIPSYLFTGEKKLSGISYYTGGTINYDISISNLYRNTYYIGNAITFNDVTPSLLSVPSGIELPVCVGNENKVYQPVSSISFNVLTPRKRRLNESISINTTARRTVQNTVTGGNVAISNIYLDNYPASSTNIFEGFTDEVYRLQNLLYYDSITDITNDIWDSSTSLSSNNGLQVYNDTLIYPRTNFSNTGDATKNINFGISARNYSVCTGDRIYVRYFRQVSPTTGNFVMNIGGAGGTFVKLTDPLGTTGIYVEFKGPTQTGWLDAYSNFATNNWSNGNGGRNATGGAGRAFGVNWGLTLGTRNTANTGGYIVLKITVSSGFTGYFNNITFTFS